MLLQWDIMVFVGFSVVMARPDGSKDDEITLDGGYDTSCTASNGEQGTCVLETYCNEEHVIMEGGVIDDTEMRSLDSKKTCNPGYWCCREQRSDDTSKGNRNSGIGYSSDGTSNGKCQTADGDICRWAVSLHKVYDLFETEMILFCMGTLIGSRVVLTAATCITASKNYNLFAKVDYLAKWPNDPDAIYSVSVNERTTHPKYNSGTRTFNFGLMLLEKEVEWGTKGNHGSCLEFNKPQGTCFTLGFDSNDIITSTELDVTNENQNCNNFGGKITRDRVCGTTNDTDSCIAAAGAPVVCESNGVGVVMGVACSDCRTGQVLLGSLEEASAWIIDELGTRNITKEIYLQ